MAKGSCWAGQKRVGEVEVGSKQQQQVWAAPGPARATRGERRSDGEEREELLERRDVCVCRQRDSKQ